MRAGKTEGILIILITRGNYSSAMMVPLRDWLQLRVAAAMNHGQHRLSRHCCMSANKNKNLLVIGRVTRPLYWGNLASTERQKELRRLRCCSEEPCTLRFNFSGLHRKRPALTSDITSALSFDGQHFRETCSSLMKIHVSGQRLGLSP